MRQALLFSLLLLGSAQAQTAQDIISKVDSAQKAAKDVSFRVTGTANAGGAPQKIDFTVKSIPSQNLARLEFLAPDALADNIVVADKNEVRQYLFLTNQITVTPLSKAAGSAGLSDFDFTQVGNVSAMISKYNVKLIGSSGGAGQRVYQLEAAPKGSEERTRIWINEAGWRPSRVQMIGSDGKTVADLTLSAYKTNSKLSAAALRQLPKNAQIVRQ